MSYSLSKHLNSLPLLRPWGIPHSLGHVTVLIMREHLGYLQAFQDANPSLIIDHVMLPDFEKPEEIRLVKNGGEMTLTTSGLEAISTLPENEKVFLFPSEWILTRLCQKFASLGIRNVWLAGYWPAPFGERAPFPDFYRQNARLLHKAYGFMETDQDRETFAARIKAILTGNSGWLPIAPYPEYHHPEIAPAAGDIMIDGGLSDMVGAQEEFANAVGTGGKIYGFEPIGWMAEKAREKLAPFAQYHLQCAGLGAASGEVRFASLRDSSHICADNAAGDTEVCSLTTIDEFVAANNIPRVDCIKLDIEGAELDALKGGENTIRKCKPKLIICLYHKPQDLFEIPLWLKSIVPQYRLHLAHSSCGFTDTILYARADY